MAAVKGMSDLFKVMCHVVLSQSVMSNLCNPMNCSPPPSMGILQARILEWVAMPSSKGSSQPRDLTHVFPIAGVFFTI